MKYLKRFNESSGTELSDLKNCISYISDEYSVYVYYSNVFFIYDSFYKNGQLEDPEDYENYDVNSLGGNKKSYPVIKIIISIDENSGLNIDEYNSLLSDLNNLCFKVIKSDIENSIIFITNDSTPKRMSKSDSIESAYRIDKLNFSKNLYRFKKSKNLIFYFTTEKIADLIDQSTIIVGTHPKRKEHKTFTIL